ncbi:hypothetical protein [Akkermansia sp.]|uniref:hypothetical protein n=1 Tax=Akkermansia sp. TaxID=1872421 RepID=UPI0025B7BDB9|nr:hypothetical protein [Akkermansia sp.]MCC8148958.1 hypothetical protein [Akkermansia sp.]
METTYLDDGSAWSGEPAQIAFYMVDAVGISHLHCKEVYSYHVENHVKRVEKRSTANGMTRLEVTETWQADAENPHARGRVRMTQEVDGIQTWYDYVPVTQYGPSMQSLQRQDPAENLLQGKVSAPSAMLLHILNGAKISSNKSFSLSTTLNIPLCEVANKQIGVTVSDVVSVGVQKNLFTPQNKLKAKFGAVDKFGYSVKANAKLIDCKIGVGTISCEESTGISGLDFRKIKFEIEAKIGITREI